MWNSNNLNHSQQLGLLIQTLFWEDEKKTFTPLLIGFMCIYLREPPRLIRDYHRFSRLSLFPPAYCTTILPTFHTGIDDLLQRVCHNQSCFKLGLVVGKTGRMIVEQLPSCSECYTAPAATVLAWGKSCHCGRIPDQVARVSRKRGAGKSCCCGGCSEKVAGVEEA